MNCISPLLICLIFYLSLGCSLDPMKNTNDTFENGLRKVIEEIKQTNKISEPDSSHLKGHLNASVFQRFPCTRLPPSPSKPKSVHQLRPGDIDVIAALGDSYTAARAAGAAGLNSLLHDYRGLSFSAGGDGTFRTFHSLPNILREYNPDIYGFSNSIGDYMSPEAALNVAKSGATSPDLTFEAALLIQRIKNDPLIDFENDWKLITILIGGNDLCRSCYSYYNSHIYIRHLKSTLDMFKSSLPRTFVNLVELMPVEIVRQLPRGIICERIQKYYCQCGAFPKSEEEYNSLIKERKEFQRRTEKLVSSGIYDTNDSFTVVLQTFYRNATIPTIPGTDNIDYSLFAVDCFHYSARGQSLAGLGLWNNMVQPIPQKSTNWSVTDEILCPSESHPFLATSKNSPTLSKSEDIKAYSWKHNDIQENNSKKEWIKTELSKRSYPNSCEGSTKSKTNGESVKEVELLIQGLTIMMIVTAMVLCLVIVSIIAYYGTKCYKNRFYQERL